MGILDRLMEKPKTEDQSVGDLSVLLSEDRAREVEILSAELSVQQADLLRAALELAMPVFRQHPEFFEFVNGKAKGEW